jgi:hypothetical protein
VRRVPCWAFGELEGSRATHRAEGGPGGRPPAVLRRSFSSTTESISRIGCDEWHKFISARRPPGPNVTPPPFLRIPSQNVYPLKVREDAMDLIWQSCVFSAARGGMSFFFVPCMFSQGHAGSFSRLALMDISSYLMVTQDPPMTLLGLRPDGLQQL